MIILLVSLLVDGSQLVNMHIMDRDLREYRLYAKSLLSHNA